MKCSRKDKGSLEGDRTQRDIEPWHRTAASSLQQSTYFFVRACLSGLLIVCRLVHHEHPTRTLGRVASGNEIEPEPVCTFDPKLPCPVDCQHIIGGARTVLEVRARYGVRPCSRSTCFWRFSECTGVQRVQATKRSMIAVWVCEISAARGAVLGVEK